MGASVLGEKEPNDLYFKKCDLKCLFIGFKKSEAFTTTEVSSLR